MASPVTAVTPIGTSCSFSWRFCAVTTTSCSVVAEDPAAPGCACSSARAAGDAAITAATAASTDEAGTRGSLYMMVTPGLKGPLLSNVTTIFQNWQIYFQ